MFASIWSLLACILLALILAPVPEVNASCCCCCPCCCNCCCCKPCCCCCCKPCCCCCCKPCCCCCCKPCCCCCCKPCCCGCSGYGRRRRCGSNVTRTGGCTVTNSLVPSPVPISRDNVLSHQCNHVLCTKCNHSDPLQPHNDAISTKTGVISNTNISNGCDLCDGGCIRCTNSYDSVCAMHSPAKDFQHIAAGPISSQSKAGSSLNNCTCRRSSVNAAGMMTSVFAPNNINSRYRFDRLK